jgi:murein DD-endopeptidase MepM/ murein hydrolase activator NlpD
MKLTIVPHNSESVREIKINNVLIFLVVLVIGVCFVERYSRARTVSNPAKLAESNRELESELDICQKEFESLAHRTDTLLHLTAQHQSVNTMVSTSEAEAPSKSIDELLTDLHESKLIMDRVSAKLSQLPDVAKFTPSISPVEGYIIRSFGKTEYVFTGEDRFCLGIDLAAPLGSRVCAAACGRVKSARLVSHEGLTIELEHKYGFITRYSHLSLLKVSKGQTVKRNDVIGFVGTTGKTIGPMLHYEVWVNGEAKDPVDYILTEVSYF